MEITFLQVTIEPWTYSGTEDKQLKIKVRADGKTFTTVQIFRPDDFESTLDRMMDIAKMEIKNLITKKQD